MITILVGKSENKFTVPEGHIRTVPFFNDLFKHDFKESKEGIIRMPEDDPAVIELFLAWLLRHPDEWFIQPKTGTELAKENKAPLATRLILFADKIQLPALATRGLELLWDNMLLPKVLTLDALVPQLAWTYAALKDIPARFVPLHLILVLNETHHFSRELLDVAFLKRGKSGLFQDLNKHRNVFDMVKGRIASPDDHKTSSQRTRNMIVQIVLRKPCARLGEIMPSEYIDTMKKEAAPQSPIPDVFPALREWIAETYKE